MYQQEKAMGEAPNAGMHDNFLKAASASITEAFGRAKASNLETLKTLRDIGSTLNECRDTLGNAKAFNEWAEAQNFPFGTAWRKRLMQLEANWEAIMDAVNAAPEEKRKWSVDGVIAIWNATKAPKGGDAEGVEGGEGGEGGDAEPKAKPETKAEKLERMLREALDRIAKLEAENEALKAGGPKAKAKEAPRDQAKRGPYTGPKMDAATVARAKKVHGLWQRPGTDGEGEAAKGRLEQMAKDRGMGLEDFLVACGLA
jgi:hypothetical protein